MKWRYPQQVFITVNTKQAAHSGTLVLLSLLHQRILPEPAADNLQVSQAASTSGVPPLGLSAPVVCETNQTPL